VYVPPEDSKYWSEEAFTEIENEYRFLFNCDGLDIYPAKFTR